MVGHFKIPNPGYRLAILAKQSRAIGFTAHIQWLEQYNEWWWLLSRPGRFERAFTAIISSTIKQWSEPLQWHHT
jgi:hypothetical protein